MTSQEHESQHPITKLNSTPKITHMASKSCASFNTPPWWRKHEVKRRSQHEKRHSRQDQQANAYEQNEKKTLDHSKPLTARPFNIKIHEHTRTDQILARCLQAFHFSLLQKKKKRKIETINDQNSIRRDALDVQKKKSTKSRKNGDIRQDPRETKGKTLQDHCGAFLPKRRAYWRDRKRDGSLLLLSRWSLEARW